MSEIYGVGYKLAVMSPCPICGNVHIMSRRPLQNLQVTDILMESFLSVNCAEIQDLFIRKKLLVLYHYLLQQSEKLMWTLT